MIDTFSIEAILPDHGIKTMTDKGIRLLFDTQEPTEEQFREVFRMKGRHGKLVFASPEHVFAPEDLDVADVTLEYKGEKTPSQRLRNVVFRIWEQRGSQGEFETYYRAKMDAIINQLKEQLN